MDSDEKLEISTKRKAKKEQVQKRIARKMISLEESARKKQTEDDVCGVSLRSKGALEQDPHKVATDVEQGIVTEALRHRVRGKLKTIKTEQEEFFSENQDVPTEGYPNNPEVNVEEAPVDEGLAFFTSTFEDHSKLEEVDPSVDQKSINNGLQNVCDLNEQTPLLHHVKEILPELLEVKPAEFEDNNLNKEKQCDYLFVPSIFPVIHRSKLLKNMLPRNLEDEGFYIPRKPYISRNTYHKMENRLLQEEGGKDWFEENGELISLPSPIKQSHNYRVSFPNETDIQLRTTYRKAMNPELEKCIIAKPGEENKIYQLDLNISSIVFSHHSLFNCEQVLASRLLDIYECFQKRQRQNVTHLLSEKLRALTSATKLSESNLKINQLSTSTLKDFRSQIRHTKRLYDKECQRDSSLIQNMLKIWKQIKSVRKKQGFISTTVKLQFQRLANNSEMDSCDVKISEEDDKVGCLDSSHILQTETDFGGWNEPLFIPHLTFVTEITTANLCPIDEQKRRDKVNLKSYFIKIYYNSKLVSSTLEAPLCQDFKVIFQQMFRIQVLNWPESLCLEYAKSQEQSDSKYFRLEQLQEEFNFATTEDIKNCKRFQLLQLRSLGQLDYYCFQQIPLYDREIPDTVFQQYGSQLEKDMLMTDVDPISAQRNSSISFISMMRKQIRKRIVTIWHKYNLSDIVNDYEEIISMSQLSDAIFKLGERRRHLKPQRKERRKVPAQAISDGDVKLLIRILRAYNIPTRKVLEIKGAVAHSSSYLLNRMSRGRHVFSGNSAFTVDLLSEVSVHPFVEITFQNTVYQTSTADGSHPCWNEELQVDFTSPGHDYTFIGLSKIKEDININIFDEFVIEKHEDACPKSCSGHSYVRKNWLGSVTFPFSALLEQSKICGTFQVNTPPVLLGYTWSKTYVPPIEDCYRQNLKEYTFLTIFATIEPQLSSAENNLESDKLVDHEDETLLQRANIFKQACKMMFPKRRIITSVFDNQGRNILVTKYITPLNPPQVLLDMCPDDPNSASDFVSRFVSLIPCISDTVDENDDVDIWMTSEHCIKWGVCNKEEHAVLLCNYLLYIGKKAWVLLGTSVLEGKVAYVAAQENGYFFLWNPLSSQCYKQFDAFCPLQSVDCLINCENVWFNVQQNSSPMCISFDISKECFWKQMLPVISQDFKTQTVQPEKILYIPTDESLVEELQNRIEKALKNKMMEWRSQHPTRWHRQCTSVLRQILPKLEFRNGDTAKEKEENYLETFHEHYWVTGFPIQMLYLDVQSITEAVYQTGIHSSEIPNTEFALAVYIHPYPNNMLSVWIYLVSLVRHQ
ncbi:protein CC2D2B isoform X4 [Sceloporus undulatus]|uniref:protein CC2D2B isoform X4 n=1 Tax=Sceloporus undulatus TaxID=8520 RepID=UPI001C4BC4D4|nr:protein CC2D2B isoform X4 [Sceloporus undulatus]